MKFKRLFLVGILFLAIFMMGIVSASDNATSDDLALVEDVNVQAIDSQIELESNFDESSNLSSGAGNFKEMNDLVKNAKKNDVIKLKKDYSYDKSSDSSLKNGISIKKSVTINGNGHAINGKNKRIFLIEANDVTLKNINFKNTNIRVEGNNTLFIDCSFKDCTSYNGGAIYSDANNLNVSRCTFTRCMAENEGGAIFTWGDDCTIANSKFINCKVTMDDEGSRAYGGGAICGYGKNFNIDKCSFKDCSAIGSEVYGSGVVYFYGDGCDISNCNFINCSNHAVGGAIDLGGNDLNVFNCSFVDCSSYNGGAIYGYECNSSVVDCSFTDCYARYDGGAICFNGKSDSSVIGCSFINCSADDEGDAIYFDGKFTLANSSFVNGAWFATDEGNVSNITSVNYGLGVFDDLKKNEHVVLTEDYILPKQVSINVNNVVIDGNGHFLSGNRVFYIKGSHVTIMNCNFVDCIGDGLSGGAIYLKGKDLNLINCSFRNCFAEYGGGAIYSDKGDCLVVGCSFINCTAVDDGGAVYVYDGDCSIVNSTFSKCHTDNVGVVELWGKNCSVVGCEFTDCFAKIYGGAIHFSWETYGFVNDCSFINCSADEYGDAICFDDEFSLSNSSFVNGAWYAFEKGKLSNVTVDGVAYDIAEFENIKNNARISLTKDYSLVSPIIIDAKNVVIDGNGHSLTGSSIFQITGKNVTVMNCNFENCSYADYYSHGVIYSKNYKLRLLNCNFINCHTLDASTIYSQWSNAYIFNCSFINCSTNKNGGAIYAGGVTDYEIVDCRFEGCLAKGKGGAIITGNCKSFKITNSTFIECSAKYGAVVHSDNANFIVNNCRFIKCSAKPEINALYTYMYYNDGSYFEIHVFGVEGFRAEKTSVTFKIDGKKFKTVKTDSNGCAKVKITKTPGNYKISATALGKTQTFKFAVKKVLSLTKVKVKKSAKKLVLTACLLEGDTPLKNKKVTFKFNGKTYKAKTNKKGVAKVTIKKSQLKKLRVGKKVKYQATYVKSTVKYTVKVAR